MTRTVELWFEFASTYSYPAAMRAEEACTIRGLTLIWRPFLLGPIFAAQGLSDSPFNLNPVKGAYMWRDLERICAGLGLPFRRPSTFPRGSLLAARIACSHPNAPWLGAFIRGVFSANFAEDRDIGDAKCVAEILSPLHIDTSDAIARATTPEAKAALKHQTAHAQKLGLFGAPSFLVNGEMFWGHDRLDAALDWAAAGGASLRDCPPRDDVARSAPEKGQSDA